jgi:Sec-independent protein translocase protein TatA
MRRMTVGVTVALVVLLVAGPALAFTCPKLQKDAGEAIAKAEGAVAKVADAKAKAAAQAMVNLAKELNKASEASHKKGADTKDANLHYRAEAEAKAAKALAGMAGM